MNRAALIFFFFLNPPTGNLSGRMGRQILSYGNNIDMREERKQIKVISELLKQTIWGVMMPDHIDFDGCIKPL